MMERLRKGIAPNLVLMRLIRKRLPAYEKLEFL